jgi:D-glycero-D-manno-heptose 1,7-bisphosphate phosphatase
MPKARAEREKKGKGLGAVFLDRDGTICVLVDYMDDPAQVELIPGSAKAIKLFNELGLKVIVITNQSALARGFFTEQVLDAIHERMNRTLEKEGAHIDAIYFCPHHPDDKCGCRKPAPGLVIRSAKDNGIDLEHSFMVGDKMDDVEAGKASGCKGILVLTGYGSGELALRDKWHAVPDHIADNLLGAAEWIEKQVKLGD